MLLICRFCICKFVYWLKFICNPNINSHGVFVSFMQSREAFELPDVTFPSEVKLLLCFHTLNKCPLHSLFSAVFSFAFLCLFLVISLSKMPDKRSAEVLSTVPKHQKAAMCLTGKICKKGSATCTLSPLHIASSQSQNAAEHHDPVTAWQAGTTL